MPPKRQPNNGETTFPGAAPSLATGASVDIALDASPGEPVVVSTDSDSVEVAKPELDAGERLDGVLVTVATVVGTVEPPNDVADISSVLAVERRALERLASLLADAAAAVTVRSGTEGDGDEGEAGGSNVLLAMVMSLENSATLEATSLAGDDGTGTGTTGAALVTTSAMVAESAAAEAGAGRLMSEAGGASGSGDALAAGFVSSAEDAGGAGEGFGGDGIGGEIGGGFGSTSPDSSGRDSCEPLPPLAAGGLFCVCAFVGEVN